VINRKDQVSGLMNNSFKTRSNHSATFLLCFLCSITSLLLSPYCTYADHITIKNGDKLSGKITSMDPSTVTISVTYAGNIKIDRNEIAELHTDHPLRIMLKDDSLLFGNISKPAEGPATIQDSITDSRNECDFRDISYFNPPPHIAGEGTYFTGEINFSGEFKEGNTVSTKLGLDFKTQYDAGIQRYLFNGTAQWESKNRTKSEDNWFLQGRYNRLFTHQWYTLGNMSLEFDEFKGLMLRSVLGGGAGYRFWDEKYKKLSFEGGPNFVYENYKITGKSYDIAFRESGNLEYPLFRHRLFFYHNHSIVQGLTDTEIMSVRTTCGLKVPVGLFGLQTAIQLDWNWDRKPSPGRQKSDTTVTLKGGYGW